MSKWADEFVGQYGETGTVKGLTKEIKDAINKKRCQKEIDKTLTEVIRGKHRRKLI